uniref:Uncharacterized protein n=1 Tax=Arundo donax TaxID=35708 RepID=A0A0A9ANT2_ARUDO
MSGRTGLYWAECHRTLMIGQTGLYWAECHRTIKGRSQREEIKRVHWTQASSTTG